MPNIEHINEIIDVIKTNGDITLDMSIWRIRNLCGTCACIGGISTFLKGNTMNDDTEPVFRSPSQIAADNMGIPFDIVGELFFAGHSDTEMSPPAIAALDENGVFTEDDLAEGNVSLLPLITADIAIRALEDLKVDKFRRWSDYF